MTKEESKFVLELTKQEARGLLTCINMSSASGTDLDSGQIIEEKLLKFLNHNKMEQTAVKELVDKMKQTDDKVDLFAYSLGLQDGAKWQQEQSKEMEVKQKRYTKTDVEYMLYKCCDDLENNKRAFWDIDGLVDEIISTFKSE